MLVVLMKILENCKEVVYNLNAKSNQNIIPVNINENARISSMEKKDISKSKTVNDNKQVENVRLIICKNCYQPILEDSNVCEHCSSAVR